MDSVQISFGEIRILLLVLLLVWQLWSGRIGFGSQGVQTEFDSRNEPLKYGLIIAFELGLLLYAVVQHETPSRGAWDRKVLFTINLTGHP